MSIVLEQLQKDTELCAILERGFDVRLDLSPEVAGWLTVSSSEAFQPFASEGAGGAFLIGERSGRVLFATSEGQAGIVAESLMELMQLLAALPHWRDVLKFSGGGRLEEMRRVLPYLEAEAQDFTPKLETYRRTLTNILSLSPLEDPVVVLHRATHAGDDVTVRADDGSQFSPLFNRFTVNDNPLWKAA